MQIEVINQNFYSALTAFTDFGMVTGKYNFNKSSIPVSEQHLFPDDKEKLHFGYGSGLYLVLNDNFAIAINYGLAAEKRDGKNALYINLGFLFWWYFTKSIELK